jgi:hypothetical protein
MSHNPKIETPFQAYEEFGKKIYKKVQEQELVTPETIQKVTTAIGKLTKVVDDNLRRKNKAATSTQRKG